MKRLEANGVAAVGLGHIEKITAQGNCILHRIAQENDLGIDAIIEFIVDQQSTGCCIGVQIKSGVSYINNGVFFIRTDARHNAYWCSHILPIAGIVYNPDTDVAKWVDITDHLNINSPPRFENRIQAEHIFDVEHFRGFRDHFLAYRDRYSDERSFGRSLSALSRINNPIECSTGIRSLFSFHRNKPETWFFLLASLRYFKGSPVLRMVVHLLSHVPGHPDIFWIPGKNTISDESSRIAEGLFRTLLSRDDVLTLISAIDGETGISRGSMGQCVESIIELVPNRDAILESIAGDVLQDGRHRFWAALLMISCLQWRQLEHCIEIIRRLLPTFAEDEQERLLGLQEVLQNGQRIDFA